MTFCPKCPKPSSGYSVSPTALRHRDKESGEERVGRRGRELALVLASPIGKFSP